VGGLRRVEAAVLDVAGYSSAADQLTVRAGNGNKARTACAQGGAAGHPADGLAVRRTSFGPLFCPVNKAGRVEVRRMTPQAVLYLLRRWAERAGVAAFSPHDLRRTFIPDLLGTGADISADRGLAGHANS
jgi:site-specific recombinase XerD